MLDALAFIRDHYPGLYERTRYRIIEISESLAKRQRQRAAEEGVETKVDIIQSDFFKWTEGGTYPCYIVALEVLVSPVHSHFVNPDKNLG